MQRVILTYLLIMMGLLALPSCEMWAKNEASAISKDTSTDTRSLDDEIEYHKKQAAKARSKAREYDSAAQRSLSDRRVSDLKQQQARRDEQKAIQQYHEKKAEELTKQQQAGSNEE